MDHGCFPGITQDLRVEQLVDAFVLRVVRLCSVEADQQPVPFQLAEIVQVADPGAGRGHDGLA